LGAACLGKGSVAGPSIYARAADAPRTAKGLGVGVQREGVILGVSGHLKGYFCDFVFSPVKSKYFDRCYDH